MPSFVKDTNDFINEVKVLSIPNNAMLVSLDVESLYENVPNAEDIANARRPHEKYQQ